MKRVYNLQFWLLCFSSYLFFASFNMIIPELPDFLRQLGGEEYLGLHITLFTVTAGLSRPFSGKLADTIGRIPVMIVGTLVCFVVGFIYPLVQTVFAFLLLRLVHGFSTGFKPTGTSAFVGDVVPFKKRGEAMGLLGMFGQLGMASGPAIGGWIANNSSLDIMFYSSSVTAIFSIMILAGMKETLPDRQKFTPRLLKLTRADIYEKRVLPPSIVMALTAFPFGIMLTIIPDFSVHLGVENKGLFFTAFTLSSVAIRLLAGKASDHFGRVPVLRVSSFILFVTMIFFGFIDSAIEMFVGAVFIGCSSGMLAPTLFAWTIDLSDERFRGRGMATMFIALEIGIGLGSFISGYFFANYDVGFSTVFWTGAVTSIMAFIYVVFVKRKRYDVVKNQD